jgi:hypothetical protein
MWIRDPGWKKVGSGIRNKYPRSATLLLTTVDSQLPTSATGKNLAKNEVDFQVFLQGV